MFWCIQHYVSVSDCNVSLYRGHFSDEVAQGLDIIMSQEITAIPPHGVWVARKPSLEISFLISSSIYISGGSTIGRTTEAIIGTELLPSEQYPQQWTFPSLAFSECKEEEALIRIITRGTHNSVQTSLFAELAGGWWRSYTSHSCERQGWLEI